MWNLVPFILPPVIYFGVLMVLFIRQQRINKRHRQEFFEARVSRTVEKVYQELTGLVVGVFEDPVTKEYLVHVTIKRDGKTVVLKENVFAFPSPALLTSLRLLA